MNKRLKNIIKILCFVIGLASILKLSSILVQPKGNVYNSSAVEDKTKSYKMESPDSIDVIFLGDSETYANFSPLHIWNKTGITSYVMGISAQRLCDTYELLVRSVENQNVKLVILETNCLFRTSSTYGSDGEQDTVMNTVSDMFPVFKYHSRWEEFADGDTLSGNVKEERNFKGFRVRFDIEAYDGSEWMHKTDKVNKIADKNISYLNDIKKFCEDNGIKLVLVSAPSPDCWDYEKHNGVRAWSDNNDIEFIDLNLEREAILIDWNTDTKDAGNHLNYNGAVKVSDYMADYLKNNYDFEDRREDVNLSHWNDSYTKYMNEVEKGR